MLQVITNALAKYQRVKLDYRNRDVFLSSLLFVHATMVASEPLIEAALESAQLHSTLQRYYDKHWDEERDHAQWLKSDLATAGIEPLKCDWRAAQLAGTQYYLVKHVAPDALLGYMAVLECNPASLADITALEKAHGTRLLRTMRYHAENDTSHGDDLLKFIEENARLFDIPLIVENIERTSLLLQIFYSAAEFHPPTLATLEVSHG